jgi:16S rRNA (uracil1498-N3)-methyltransferase
VPRFFIKLQDINNKIITLDEEQSKKVRKVLRMKIGDTFRAFDGKGWDYIAELTKVTNDYSLAHVIEQTRHELTTQVTLVQALPKNLKIEFILQKATELGVDKIVFFESEFSQVDATRINTDKVKRWRRIAQEAAEQCGRVFIPDVELYTEGLESLITALDRYDYQPEKNMVYLDMNGLWPNDPALAIDPAKVALFVGPEGGFAPNEKTLFDKLAVKKVKIAENILRSETAGMTFLGQLPMINR